MEEDKHIPGIIRGLCALALGGGGAIAAYVATNPVLWVAVAGLAIVGLVAGWILGPRMFEFLFDLFS